MITLYFVLFRNFGYKIASSQHGTQLWDFFNSLKQENYTSPFCNHVYKDDNAYFILNEKINTSKRCVSHDGPPSYAGPKKEKDTRDFTRFNYEDLHPWEDI